MQNGEAPSYPEPLAKAIGAAEQAVADATANIQHHEQAIERERLELAKHQAVLGAYMHSVVLWDESHPAAPETEPPKSRRPPRDIVGMVRNYLDTNPGKEIGPIANALGLRASQVAAALAKVITEERDDAPPAP